MEDFDEILAKFWSQRQTTQTGIWHISTEIIQHSNDRWIKATIYYLQTPLVTAHSEDFKLGDIENAEKQAIFRAIKLLPPKGGGVKTK